VCKPSGPVGHVRQSLAPRRASSTTRPPFAAFSSPAITGVTVRTRKVGAGSPARSVHRGARSVSCRAARYADIVLPAAFYLETQDLYRATGRLQSNTLLGRRLRAVAWSNFRLAQALAKEWASDPVFRMPERRSCASYSSVNDRLQPLIPTKCASRTIRMAPAAGQSFRTPPANSILFEVACRQERGALPAGAPTDEEKAAGSLAAATAHRAGIFFSAHDLVGRCIVRRQG